VPIVRFPEPEAATPEGILAVGGDLHPQSLLLAYRQGIFPWPIENLGLAWFQPPSRAVLFFDEIHVPRSLEKIRRRTPFTFSIDRNFAGVIDGCAGQARPGQAGTWITPGLKRAFVRFHELGFAHSVEAWSGRELVAGVYGVCVEGVFSAESMFHRTPNASKLALLHLTDFLGKQGLHWIDIQVMTPHMKHLGAREITRREYLRLLQKAQKSDFKPFANPPQHLALK
jgi:leucyl/phenylalanyl-tRNA--protein transferase